MNTVHKFFSYKKYKEKKLKKFAHVTDKHFGKNGIRELQV